MRQSRVANHVLLRPRGAAPASREKGIEIKGAASVGGPYSKFAFFCADSLAAISGQIVVLS